MSNVKLIVLLVLGTLFTNVLGDPPHSGGKVINLDANDVRVVVGPHAVSMPKGVFLLVRKGNEIGAIRFTGILPGNADFVGRSTYESFFQGDGSGSFLSTSVIKRSGELSTKPLTGIGRFSFGGGKRKLKVGKWAFAYHFPTWVHMWPYGEDQRDYGYEFAPTSAREIAEVDVFNKNLRWFRYDANKSITLLLSDLPKKLTLDKSQPH